MRSTSPDSRSGAGIPDCHGMARPEPLDAAVKARGVLYEIARRRGTALSVRFGE